MPNTAKTKAERMFAESDRKAKAALNEREKARAKSRAHTASLRALRLAKEAVDKEAADAAEAAKPTKKKKAPATKAPAKKPRVY